MSIGRIESVLTRGDAVLVITWDDGHRAEIDVGPIIAARKGLAPLADPQIFRRLRLVGDGWSIEWPDLGDRLRRGAASALGRRAGRRGHAAAAFRAWMEGRGLTLDRAAEALGLSRRTVAYYLSGEQPVPKTVMLATEGYDNRRAA